MLAGAITSVRRVLENYPGGIEVFSDIDLCLYHLEKQGVSQETAMQLDGLIYNLEFAAEHEIEDTHNAWVIDVVKEQLEGLSKVVMSVLSHDQYPQVANYALTEYNKQAYFAVLRSAVVAVSDEVTVRTQARVNLLAKGREFSTNEALVKGLEGSQTTLAELQKTLDGKEMGGRCFFPVVSEMIEAFKEYNAGDGESVEAEDNLQYWIAEVRMIMFEGLRCKALDNALEAMKKRNGCGLPFLRSESVESSISHSAMPPSSEGEEIVILPNSGSPVEKVRASDTKPQVVIVKVDIVTAVYNFRDVVFSIKANPNLNLAENFKFLKFNYPYCKDYLSEGFLPIRGVKAASIEVEHSNTLVRARNILLPFIMSLIDQNFLTQLTTLANSPEQIMIAETLEAPFKKLGMLAEVAISQCVKAKIGGDKDVRKVMEAYLKDHSEDRLFTVTDKGIKPYITHYKLQKHYEKIFQEALGESVGLRSDVTAWFVPLRCQHITDKTKKHTVEKVAKADAKAIKNAGADISENTFSDYFDMEANFKPIQLKIPTIRGQSWANRLTFMSPILNGQLDKEGGNCR